MPKQQPPQQPPLQRPGGQWPDQPPQSPYPPQQYQQQYAPPPGYYPPQMPPPKKGMPAIAIIGIIIGGLFVLIVVIGVVAAETGAGKGATATPQEPSSQVSSLSSTRVVSSLPAQPPTITPLPIATRGAPAVVQSTPTTIPLTPQVTTAQSPLKLVASGYGQNGREVGVGFVVQNPDPLRTLVNSQYQIAAYDSAGIVLTTDSGYIGVALPSQSLGIGRSLILADGQTAAKVDVQIKSGSLTDKKYPSAFTADKVTIVPGDASSIGSGSATGVMKSNATQDIKEVEADTVLYDSTGKIIGGGFTFIDFIPAGGQAAVEMSLVYAGKPANAAMYGLLSGLSTSG